MNMISARVPSKEDDNSHDSTLSHGVIKQRFCFFVCFEYAPSSGESL